LGPGAPVHPQDGPAQRAPVRVHRRHGLPLGRKADGGDALLGAFAGPLQAVPGGRDGGPPPVVRVLFGPEGPGVMDRVLAAGLGPLGAVRLEKHGFAGGGADVDGQQQRAFHLSTSGLTTCLGRWLRRTASRFSAAMMAILVRVSMVALPMWGRSTTLSSSARPGASLGSSSYTSRAAPAMIFFLRASTSACSSTTGPRAGLMRYAVGFIMASSRAPMRCLVSGVKGTVSMT